MISADSILSMFTDRFTLLKYLQQLDGDVQKLLEKAVTSISVDKVPDSEDEYTLTINFEDGTSETTPAFVIAQGEDGRGISSIAKTGTTGNVDTYTITYTDETTSTFTVTNASPLYQHTVDITISAGSQGKYYIKFFSSNNEVINTFSKLAQNENKIKYNDIIMPSNKKNYITAINDLMVKTISVYDETGTQQTITFTSGAVTDTVISL